MPTSQQEIRAVQTALSELGLYKGSIDGLWGSESEKALQSYLSENPNDTSLENLKKYMPKTPEELYVEGQETPLANIYGVSIPFIKNMLRIDTPLHITSDGMLKQAIALYLKNRPHNADQRIRRNGSITIGLRKNENGDYKWTQLNGNRKAHDDSLLLSKATDRSAEFVLT